MIMLEECFKAIIGRTHYGHAAQDRLWYDIDKAYSAAGRHYHNMQHLEQLYSSLSAVQDQFKDPEVMWLALCYHDIVYETGRQDNEDQSAAFARDILTALQFPEYRVQQCTHMILATKSHTAAADKDTNYFTDADLSILGQNWERYIQYAKAIRKEYCIYPDEQYYPGRKKVIRRFLETPRLFKTGHFYRLYEQQARKNLQQELHFYEEM